MPDLFVVNFLRIYKVKHLAINVMDHDVGKLETFFK